MGLAAVNLAITPTPSHLIDGHYPDGNDGTAGIPLTWAVVPDFTQKQQGTPFSINLFSTYLTQPGDLSATASLKSGSFSGGWSLASNGLLAYDGSGVASGTIVVRATRFGFTSDTNSFTFQSIAAIGADNIAPTIPTGLALVSKTATTINVTCDAPSDVPTATITASGLKEVRFSRGGVFDGVSAITGGKSVLLAAADVGAASTRRYRGGHYTAVARNQQVSAGGLPNPGSTSDTGPVTSDTKAITLRYYWNELEPTQGNYTFSRITNELAQCAARNVYLFVMIEVRTFASASANANNPAPAYLAAYTDTFPSNGHLGYQMRRWDPTVLNRFNALVTAIGALFDSTSVNANNAFFGGIATQETSTGSPDRAVTGYTPTGFCNAQVSEATYIAAACPNSRPMPFINFLSINNSENTSSPHISNNDFGMRLLEGVVAAIQPLGAIIAFPDLVPTGSITTRVYPIINDYTNGTSNSGITPMPGVGPCAGSVQQSEWTADGNPAGQAHMTDLYDYATNTNTYGSNPSLNSPLSIPIIIWNWQTSAAAGNFNQQFNPDAVNIIHAHPSFGTTYTPPASMVPGSLSQSGVDYNVTGAGTGIGASSDQWSVGRVQCNGDFTLIAKLNGISGAVTTGAVAGISIRETTDPSARAAHLVATTSKLRSRYRGAPSAAMTNVVDVASVTWSTPLWLKITRASSTFSYFYSLDGLAWTAMGTATIGMATTVYAELFASSVTVTTTVTAAFQQANIQALSAPTYTFSGLAPGTAYALTAKTRDQSSNDSASSATLNVTSG